MSLEDVHRFGLGYVAVPEPGHEQYHGRLVLPYVRRIADEYLSVGLKYRRVGDGPGAKYLGDTRPRLYNTIDAIDNDDRIALCEGEIDALTASVCGIPAVGIPGVDTWNPIWASIFRGYETVWMFADGDQPGRDFAKRIVKELGPYKVHVIRMPDGTDVNSYARDYGRDALRKLVGLGPISE